MSDERISKALDLANRFGGVNGSYYNKMWVIDQMVRALTDCPMVKKTGHDVNQRTYEYETQGESEEYKKWVSDTRNGKDGPDTYAWETGTSP